MENNTLCNRHSLGVNNHTKMYVTYTRIYGWSDYGGESSYQPGYRLENMMWMTLLVYDYIIPGEKSIILNSFKLFRTICRSTCIFRNSYFNFMYCRLDDICKNRSGITYNRLIIIVIKNQCPFCGKSLRVVPINSEEYCPHCGCKIEQEHKKIQV